MGYRTNPLARALPTGRTSLLAIIVADVTNPFFFEILRGAEEVATEAGYTLLVADVQESVDAERQALDRTIPMVEGVVLATSRMSDSSIRVAAKQRPTVVLNRSMSDIASVATDNSRGTRRAVEHLANSDTPRSPTSPDPTRPGRTACDGRPCAKPRTSSAWARRLGPFAPTQAGGLSAAGALANAQHRGVRVQRPHGDRADAGARHPRHPRSGGRVRRRLRQHLRRRFLHPAADDRRRSPASARCGRGADAARRAARPRRALPFPTGPVEAALLPARLVIRSSTGTATRSTTGPTVGSPRAPQNSTPPDDAPAPHTDSAVIASATSDGNGLPSGGPNDA